MSAMDDHEAANNACYTGSPDIDYFGTVTIDVSTGQVRFDGKVDEFPAYEMYAAANGGAGKMMFTLMPDPGKDPGDLPGGANRPITGSTTLP